jgi:hypothetical protein
MRNPADTTNNALIHAMIDQVLARYSSVPNDNNNVHQNSLELVQSLNTDRDLTHQLAAIDAYLGNAANQEAHLYRLFATQRRNMREAQQRGQMSKPAEHTQPDIIPGFTLEQLRQFFTTTMQRAIVAQINQDYVVAKHNKPSPESQTLAATLRRAEEPINTKWEAILHYCQNPQNSKKRLYRIILSVFKNYSLTADCRRAFEEARQLMAERKYDKAIDVLKVLPTYETHKDSPFTLADRFFALCEAYEGLGDYSLLIANLGRFLATQTSHDRAEIIRNYLAQEKHKTTVLYHYLNAEFKSDKAEDTYLIADMTLRQLRNFFNEEEKNTLIKTICQAYQDRGRLKTKSSASHTLYACLSGADNIDTRWQALVAYCMNPENKPRTMWDCIEKSLLRYNIRRSCETAFDKANSAINRARIERNEEAWDGCVAAIKTLLEIPYRRSDSPIKPKLLCCALSEAYEVLGLNIANNDATRADAAEQFELAYQYFSSAYPNDSFLGKKNDNQALAEHQRMMDRKIKLFGLIRRHADKPMAQWNNYETNTERQFKLFQSSAGKGLSTGVLAGMVPGGVVFVASPFTGLFVLLVMPAGLLLTAAGAVAGSVIGGVSGSAHGLARVASRKMLTSLQLQQLANLLHLGTQAREGIQETLIQSIVTQYSEERTLATSDSSQELLNTLVNGRASIADKWDHLQYFMANNENNGKRLFVTIFKKLSAEPTLSSQFIEMQELDGDPEDFEGAEIGTPLLPIGK